MTVHQSPPRTALHLCSAVAWVPAGDDLNDWLTLGWVQLPPEDWIRIGWVPVHLCLSADVRSTLVGWPCLCEVAVPVRRVA
jgi:hypothetical protein